MPDEPSQGNYELPSRCRTELRFGVLYSFFFASVSANYMALMHLHTTPTGFFIVSSVIVVMIAAPLIGCLTKHRVPIRRLLSTPAGISIALISAFFAFAYLDGYIRMLSGDGWS